MNFITHIRLTLNVVVGSKKSLFLLLDSNDTQDVISLISSAAYVASIKLQLLHLGI